MRKALLTLCLISASAASHADPIPSEIKAWLKPLAVQSAELENGTLTILMKKPRVTDEIYHTVIVNAVCMSEVNKPGSWGKANIKSVEVLNQFGMQGRIFTGGRKDCAAIGKMKSSEIDLWLLDRTKHK